MTLRQLVIAVFVLLLTGNVFANEVITRFHSDIRIFDDGHMQVTESISVLAEHNRIKRGIYRDFPLNYEDELGNHYKVGFEIISVRRNGIDEPFHTKNTAKGIRIYMGDKNKYVDRGEHRYDITYQTNRQLGFFEQHDELYWNVTGNDWAFPIIQASASVNLPAGIQANDIKLEGYTGAYGSKLKNYHGYVDDLGVAQFRTTQTLRPQEGLSIVVSWPKGYVAEPTFAEKVGYILQDNRGIMIASLGLLVILCYYYFFWSRVGKDPEAGIIIPHYEPPAGYSPASMRFINNMGYDKGCFSAALINLAVKGYLDIDEVNKKFTLTKKTGSEQTLAAGEKTLLTKLFNKGASIELDNKNHARISAALDAHEASLQRDYEKKYFITNFGYFVFGAMLTVFILIIAALLQNDLMQSGMPALFLMVWLSIWSFAVFGLVTNAWQAWRRASSPTSIIAALGASLFAIPFLFFEVMALGFLAQQTSIVFPVLVVIAVGINWLFYELLKAPTLAGRNLLDKIEGFKLYIDVAERQELEYRHAGGKTPELFERLLPYAIALDIEHSWAKQFESVLQQASIDGQQYKPGWYHGSHWHSHHLTDFTSSVGSSLTNAVSSSSRAPGSSSGGGGGGFSGGGGGGGGGGGW